MLRLAKWMVAASCLMAAGKASATPYAYAVQLASKDGTPYRLSQPLQFLSERALARRQMQGIAVDSSDLPVNTVLVDSVLKLTGGSLHGVSRWLNMCVILLDDTTKIHALDGHSFVKGIVPLVPRHYSQPRAGVKPDALLPAKKITGSPTYYGNTWQQTSLVHGDPIHDAGYKGNGKLIAVLDAGFVDTDTHPGFANMWTASRVLDKRNFVLGNDQVFVADVHGTRALSTIAGDVAGTYVGAAPEASIALYVTENSASETPLEMTNILLASERADSVGVDIITTSLGYNYFDNAADNLIFATDLDGKTTIAAQAANTATTKGMLFIASAGNEGGNSWNMILTPGDADSALTIGSVDFSGTVAANSGYGPNAAGQVKPDVCVMGQSAAVFMGMGYGTQSGTSFATPQVAGWAACLWQEYPAATPAHLRRAITRCANSFSTPGTHNGYGIPDFSCARQMLLGVGVPPAMASGSRITAMPNPSDGAMKLLVTPDTDQRVDLAIYDVTGKTLFAWSATFRKGFNEPVELSLAALPRGTYVLKAVSPTWQQVQRIVLK